MRRHIERRLIILSIVISIAIAFASCVSKTSPNSTKTLPWEVTGERFDTLDLARAQAETPFPIILPDYVPDVRNDPPPPQITGLLKTYQETGEVEIEVFYLVDLGNEAKGVIQIWEHNYPVTAGDPKLNPELEPIEIKGKTVITEGDFGSGFRFYYSSEGIYFIVEVDNISAEESMKVIESMIK